MFKRILTTELIQLASKFPLVAITGPRQSGKTTILRATFPELAYVSLEDLDTREFAESDPRGFLGNYAQGAILDEVQRVPKLFSYLQTHVDKQAKPGQFILSGSQNFLLLENITQSLAGRVALLNLLPLSLVELKQKQPQLNNLEEKMFTGLYPKLYKDNISPSDWYPNYIQTYVERDVRLIKNITDLSTFQRFLKMCANRCGQLVNLSALATDCGITHNTAKAWLSVLESSFIIFLLQPHYNNLNKRIIKSPKLYFYDTGLVCSLLGINNYEQLSAHYLRGGIFETFIIAELCKYYFNQGIRPPLYFWRDQSGHEVDCLIEKADELIPVEIKSGKTVASDFFSGINYWRDLAGQAVNASYLIYGGEQQQQRNEVQVVSWNELEELFNNI
jgi:hypothetical protein